MTEKSPQTRKEMDAFLKSRPVIIFGAGDRGVFTLYALRHRGVPVQCFCDNNPAKQHICFHGIPVLGPKILQQQYPEAFIFVASRSFYTISKQLDELGFQHYMDGASFLESFDVTNLEIEGWSHEKTISEFNKHIHILQAGQPREKLMLYSLDIVITERCSLRCLNCSNLMQYYASPKDCDVELLFSALDRLMAEVDSLYEFRVLGGESFIVKRLPCILEKLSRYENAHKIVVYTNATQIPKPDVIQALHHPKITTYITSYGALSRRFEALKNMLDEQQLSYQINVPASWQDFGKIMQQNYSENQLQSIYLSCCVNDTLTLLHGKLYRCPFSAHAENLGAIPEFSSDRLDLSGRKIGDDFKIRLREFCQNRTALVACNYCQGRNQATIPVAIQAKQPLPYKICVIHGNAEVF